MGDELEKKECKYLRIEKEIIKLHEICGSEILQIVTMCSSRTVEY